jgi:hypothetical protein
LAIEAQPESDEKEPNVLVGRAGRRTVRMKLEPVTHILTRVQVTVSHSFLMKDLATAEEVLVQLAATADGSEVSALRQRH